MTATEYKSALHQVLELMEEDPEPTSEAGRKMLALVSAIELYESRIYPMVRVLPVLTAELNK